MRGFNLLQCILLTFTLLSVHSIRAQAFPSTAPPPSTMHTTDTPESSSLQSEMSLCKLCTCNGGDKNLEVDCSQRELTTVPAEKLQEMENAGLEVSRIDLSSNRITVIRTQDFYSQGTSLVTIDLRDNKITDIDDEAFDSNHLEKLYTLQLGMNKLESIPDGALSGLYLNTLDLRSNKLRTVPKALGTTLQISSLHLQDNPLGNLAHDSFNGIRRVKLLDVSKCGLSAFEACSYDYNFFDDLKFLFLDQNHITTIRKGHFACGSAGSPRLVFLDTLSIQSSGVRSIEERAFEDLIQLEHLYLNGNNLGIFKGSRVFGNLQNLKELDLSHCNITDLKRVVFKELAHLEKLYLDHNNIEVVHHRDFKFLEDANVIEINLANSNIQRIDGQPFENLTSLVELNLNNNDIDDRSLHAFGARGTFHTLQLNNNKFEHIPNLPSVGFESMTNLELNNNLISEIRYRDLQGMSTLYELFLKNNRIRIIEENAFLDALKLEALELDGLKMKHLPAMHLPKLFILLIMNGDLESLSEDLCKLSPQLHIIEAENNRIKSLPSFKDCRFTSMIFTGNELTTLEYRSFEHQYELRQLAVEDNQISNITEGCFRDAGNLEYLHARKNLLTSLPKNVFDNTTLLVNVDLSYNKLTHLDDFLFAGNIEYLSFLDVSFNELEHFGKDILPEMNRVNKLDLSHNRLTELQFPYSGLLWLTELLVTDNFDLYQVPGVVSYPNLTNIMYTYPYHCCIWSEINRNPHTFVDHSKNNSDIPPTVVPTAEPLIQRTEEEECKNGIHTMAARQRWEGIAKMFNFRIILLPNCRVEIIVPEEQLRKDRPPNFYPSGVRPDVLFGPSLNCSPAPDDFSPCGNLIDPWPLRAIVWFLWIVALLGNGAVLFISIATKEKLQVYQFFICCLAFADFCMGVYLAFLAAVDIRTYGEISFYQSALYWQNGPGCKAAGFIAVFASELSVFILVLLTLERVYTLTYTFNKNERLKMKVAISSAILAVLLAGILAALPLVGINSYSQVAVCLPYITDKWTDKMYIGLLLGLHLVGFLIIMCSYIYIFKKMSKSPAAQQKKKDIWLAAAKISILIATAFICWIPLVVIGFLALGDVKAVNTHQAKFLVVLIYPLNACLNPFIYAIFTRQFRQKMSVMIRRRGDRVSSLPSSRRFQLKRGSSAYLPANSPRNRTPVEMINLRQSRRSNSLCVHLAQNTPSSPPVRSPPSLSPPPGVYMGRRASLPSFFGSSLVRTQPLAPADPQVGSIASNNSANDIRGIQQLNLALGCGQASPSECRDGPEEDLNARVLPANLNNSLGGSQDSSNRQLPGIPEEQEDENQSVCSADFHDAQEDIEVAIEAESEELEPNTENTVCEQSDSPTSCTVSTSSPQPLEQKEQVVEELRESIDSAYSGCNSISPDITVIEPKSSPTHSCSLSRRSESFSSYDLAVSDYSDVRDTAPSTPCPAPHTKETVSSCNNHQSDLDTIVVKYSSSYESIDQLKRLSSSELDVRHSISDSQLSSVGSETSI